MTAPGKHRSSPPSLQYLPMAERVILAVGAGAVVGCFTAAMSLVYR